MRAKRIKPTGGNVERKFCPRPLRVRIKETGRGFFRFGSSVCNDNRGTGFDRRIAL